MLTTERLLLRPLAREDAGDIYAVFSHPEVTRYYEIDTMTDAAQADILLDHFISIGRLGIRLKGDSRLIGSCGLFGFNMPYRSASLGYDLSPEYWGRGIMTEALKALFGFGFSTLGMNRLNALVYPDNLASIRVLEGLGFEKEGVMREFGYWKGAFHDMSLYALLRGQWRF
ncbi:MAG: GNAT family N-acetyltransferase [Burkholderiales bacterium]|nr:GNAT family N-acetyltransferase [Burkholderiales bacterium]